MKTKATPPTCSVCGLTGHTDRSHQLLQEGESVVWRNGEPTQHYRVLYRDYYAVVLLRVGNRLAFPRTPEGLLDADAMVKDLERRIVVVDIEEVERCSNSG